MTNKKKSANMPKIDHVKLLKLLGELEERVREHQSERGPDFDYREAARVRVHAARKALVEFVTGEKWVSS